ncbi:MAG: hypothetical protein ACREUV_09625 [Burkholderiales bacterium]
MDRTCTHLDQIRDVTPARAVQRLAGRERGQLLVQSASRKKLQLFLKEWQARLAAADNKKVRWALDVDPLEF